MIINHKYKFIFIKTRKTAGTSIEIALSQFCDDKDIITPISKSDEVIRKNLGYRGPQNYYSSNSIYKKFDLRKLINDKKEDLYFNHATSKFIRENIGNEIWNEYFKFCFVRNPFDRAMSFYYWRTRKLTILPDVNEYLEDIPISFLSNWNSFTIDNQIEVDFIGRYENLEKDLGNVFLKLNIPEKLNLPRAKGGFRKNRNHYSEILNGKSRKLIERVCANEFRTFNYSWVDKRSK